MQGAVRKANIESIVHDGIVPHLTGGTKIGADPGGVLCTLQNPGLATRAMAVVDRNIIPAGGLLVRADHALGLGEPGGHAAVRR